MLVFAHRGHHVVFPENTLAAFDAAVRVGADGIETDVRLTRDGVPVLFHDEEVKGRPIADLARSDLARHTGYEVPTLTEALLRFPNVIWNIEIKAPAAIGAVLQALNAFAAKRRMLVTSFRHDLVAQCARAAPVPAGLLLSHAPTDLTTLMSTYGDAKWLRTLVWDQRVLTPTLLRQARAARWWNFVYDVADPDSLRLLAAHGVDGVITDRPDWVPAELRQPRQRTQSPSETPAQSLSRSLAETDLPVIDSGLAEPDRPD
jgi:glycerophosphoryl diester phosphodiesterase